MNKTSVKLILRKYFTHYISVACSSSSFTQCIIILFDVGNILYSSRVIRDELKYKLTRVWILLSSTDALAKYYRLRSLSLYNVYYYYAVV